MSIILIWIIFIHWLGFCDGFIWSSLPLLPYDMTITSNQRLFEYYEYYYVYYYSLLYIQSKPDQEVDGSSQDQGCFIHFSFPLEKDGSYSPFSPSFRCNLSIRQDSIERWRMDFRLLKGSKSASKQKTKLYIFKTPILWFVQNLHFWTEVPARAKFVRFWF